MTSTLPAFLHARLDEQVAEAARWRDLADRVGAAHGSPDPPEDDMLIGDYAYFALHKAADMLSAEVDAKRSLVGLHDVLRGEPGQPICQADRSPHPCLTLKLLAAPYAMHRDHDREWHPRARRV